MKKVFIHRYIALIILINTSIFSQTFTAMAEHSELSDTLGSEIVFEINVTNNSSSEITLYFLRVTKSLPEGWSSSLCFSYCFSPQLDSIVTNVNYGSTPIAPGESRNFSLHVNPALTEGEANFEIIIANLDNPAELELFELNASTSITSMENDKIDKSYKLFQNYPNPFNPETKIAFSIKKTGFGSLEVYDILGNLVSKVFEKYLTSGSYSVTYSGIGLSSGVYFYKFQVNDFIQIKRMILEK
jgi:hypothetical protein